MAALWLTVLCLAALSTAANLPRTDDVAGIMKLPITAVKRTDQSAKRQVDVGLNNPLYGTEYIINIEIGTPSQPVSLAIDTGSSDLWVDPDCATSGSVSFCESYPVYDPNNSSTAADTGTQMDLAYGKGSCSGEYLTDNIILGGITIINQQFGWATASSSLPTGIMGISWGIELIGYYNIIDQLAAQGITNSRAFSLDLGSVDTAEGSIIFGGVDTMKYTGPLEKRPIIPYYLAPDGDRYWIYMSSVGITMPGASSKIYTVPTYEQAVFLDSGGTLSRLPANLVAAMIADFPGAVAGANGIYTVPCSYRTQPGTLDFGFGNTVIHVPYHEFIWNNGPNSCIFGAVANAASNVDWVLGDTFLRSAYVVYDQDNRNLLLANSANCGTNLVPIGVGVDSVPSITGACTVSATSTSTTSPTSTSTSKTTTSLTTTTTTTSSSRTSSKTLSSTSTSTSSTSTKTSTSSTLTTSTSSKSTTSTSSTSAKTSTSSTTSSTSSSSSTKSSTTSVTSTTKTSSSTSTSTSTTKSTTKSSTTTKTSSSSTKTTTMTSSSTKTTSKSSISSTSTSKSLTTLTTTTKTSTSPTSTATMLLGYTYIGCFKDSSNPHSLQKILANDSMTIETCLEVAHGSSFGGPFAYAGVEYGRECWAATTSPAAATPTSGASACTMTCTGNAAEKCGGRGMFNLWASATAKPTPK